MAWQCRPVNPTLLPSSAKPADEALIVAALANDIDAMRDAISAGGNLQLRWMSQLGQRMCMGSAVVKAPPRRCGVDAVTDALQVAALELLAEHGYEMAPEEADQLLCGCMSSMSGPGVIRFLVRAGADIHKRDRLFFGCTILSFAKRADVVHELVGAGASLDAVDKLGATPLHAVVHRVGLALGSQPSSIADAVAVVEALLAAGSRMDAQTPSGNTPLHYALQGGDAERVRAVVSLLLLHGADASLTNIVGETPLHLLQKPERWRQAADAKHWRFLVKLVGRAAAWRRRRHLLLVMRARSA